MTLASYGRLVSSLCLCLCAVVALPAWADGDVSRIPIIGAPPGTVGLGFGLRYGASPYIGVDTISSVSNENNYDLVPLYLYEGEYLYSHGTSFGAHLFRNNTFTFDILARVRFDRLEPESSPVLEGVNEREQSLDTGFGLGIKGNWGELRAEWVHDSLNVHQGQEVDLTYRYTWRFGKLMLSPFVSAIWQDENLTNYYYGVSLSEVAPGRPYYQADDQQFMRIGLNTSYQLSERWWLYANVAWSELGDEAQNSPITDKQHTAAAMLGASYYFGNVNKATMLNGDDSGARLNEWSWKVYYGYTAQETFHKVHRGHIQSSERVDTNLVGVTFGKLLMAGPRIEYYGKFSINRRLEHEYQDDFWEYNAFVMAMGRGYSPWSKRELFRYGFGFGFSYAEEVPIIEQAKQAAGDKNTARFLNYLEAQFDVPLRNFFDSKAVKDCYVGVTIVHRSGIFATSDILGNVSGGSDVFTGHLECMR
ncbi:MAG: MipA/OmpV family protein [Pseudomonadales bacterium]